MKKNLWAFFSRFIEHEKGQRVFYKSPQRFLTVFVQIIRSFLLDLRGR